MQFATESRGYAGFVDQVDEVGILDVIVHSKRRWPKASEAGPLQETVRRWIA